MSLHMYFTYINVKIGIDWVKQAMDRVVATKTAPLEVDNRPPPPHEVKLYTQLLVVAFLNNNNNNAKISISIYVTYHIHPYIHI
jgi:hypothetical protein